MQQASRGPEQERLVLVRGTLAEVGVGAEGPERRMAVDLVGRSLQMLERVAQGTSPSEALGEVANSMDQLGLPRE